VQIREVPRCAGLESVGRPMPVTRHSEKRGATEVARPPPSRPPLHVLLLEDQAEDAELIVHELRGGYEPIARRVTSLEEMLDALNGGSWQIVLLDYTLEGGGTALQSLAAIADFDIDLPTILISGPIGEEEAADALRAGANDFVNKGNLTRLVPAIARELQQVETRRDRREDAEALKQSSERLRLALDAGGMASWEWDIEQGWLGWSERLEALFGLEPGEFGGTYEELIERVHPDDRELVGASVEEAMNTDSPAVVYRTVWPDKTIHWHERKSQLVLDADGQFQGMAGVTFDVTEREVAAQSLRESEERFRLIAEHAHDLIALLDADGRFLYASPSWTPMLGYPAGGLLGTAIADLGDPEDVDNETWVSGMLREARLRRADGSWVWVEGRRYAVEGRTESHMALIARDISERKAAEAAKVVLEGELRQAQKMEAVGRLAGGIAHDFSNLLTVISGYTQILLARPDHELQGSKEIIEISKAAEWAARLVRQLLAFSRKQVIEARPLDLTDIVRETRSMLEPLIGSHIEFSAVLAEDLGTISADGGQVEQVIMNLVVNARDAMPGGGTLVLTTGNATVAKVPTGSTQIVAPGDYVVLTVADTGRGMDPSTAGRIFEPFFTTKARGAGTGLGLATVYGIVKQGGGEIEVESELGVGTTFRLYLPRIAASPEPFRVKPLRDERLLNGTETILLVEDEETLRAIGKEILEGYGYTVLLAAEGGEALALVRDRAEPIQLLMTDVLMPGMGGLELAEKLSALQPELRILYTSGYNDNGSGLKRMQGSRYLQKPYGMQQLARTLRDLLDSPHPATPRPLSPH
jgi:two-component system, cell cycle sensor histidine kinase and response regulator CckA